MENQSLESIRYPAGRNLALAYGLMDPTIVATQRHSSKAWSECSVGEGDKGGLHEQRMERRFILVKSQGEKNIPLTQRKR